MTHLSSNTSSQIQSFYPSHLSYDSFISEVAQRINTIIETSSQQDFKNQQRELFGVPEIQELQEPNQQEIENNFLYNIPNIICYAYSELGPSAKPIILALGRMYQKFTGERLFGKDWEKLQQLPRKAIQELSDEKNLGESYFLYLFGEDYFFKNYKNKKKKGERKTYSPAELIQKSSLYRKKILENLQSIEELENGEFIRGLVGDLLGKLYDVETVSDSDFVDFLIEKCKEEIEENKRKKKQKKPKKTQTDDEDQDNEEEDKNEVRKKDPVEYLKELKRTKKSGLNTQREPLLDIQKKEEYKRRLLGAQEVSDSISEAMIEREIAHYALSRALRYQKNQTEDYNASGIPKNFVSTQEYTCFSGTWLMASLLPEYGLDTSRLFFVDSMEGAGANVYKHAYLLYQLASGKYIKIDFGFGQVFDASKNYDFQVEGLEHGLNRMYYHQNIPDNDYAGYIYRLNDGIGLIYLVSLMGKAFQEEDYEKVLEVSSIARTFDNDSYHIHELEGLAYDKLGKRELAIESYKKCLDVNPASSTANFKLGEYYFETKDYENAEKRLQKFLRIAKRAWKIDPMYSQKAHSYMDQMKQRFGTEEEKIQGFLEKYGPDTTFAQGMIENFLKEYMVFSGASRLKIIEQIMQQLGESVESHLLYCIIVVYMKEKEKKTSIFPEIKEKYQSLFQKYGQL